ncbi:ribulose bisphosphate carboxylase/oxygenaseactivase [Striga asiatica]|uniref:Ribulose bisphosphate carboxylase/oxygenase activase, chloroplastic n=1 Tax=Striga asiatica TaxID=4170 RepID=A0A5A7QTK1_STRAF|nr:ribulose bisphosphate carboxylase/oxygenaseactivase [Striga asiatica]
MALSSQISASLTKSQFRRNPFNSHLNPRKPSNFLTISCSQSQPSENQDSNAASKKQKKLSEQSSWESKDSAGKDYLYRLGSEADNMNIAVGARAGIIDDLFTGTFLGKDGYLLRLNLPADIVFDYRQKATRSFEYLQGDYYIAPLFLDKVEKIMVYISNAFIVSIAVCHIVKNYIAHLLDVKVPLILGIWGGKGQGKTFQTELIFRALGLEPIIMSAGELESERAGEPGKLIRERYRTASQVVQNQGKMSCLMINDIDAGLGRFGDTQVTVNNQIVVGTLMNIADNPTRVSIGQVWRDSDITNRIPIIVTGNDFTTLYAPLIRDGRMDKFYWQPTQDDIVNIVRRMYEKDGITRDEVVSIVREFPNQALDFYGALRSRTYDRSILKWVNDAGGAENLGTRLLKQKKEGKLPVFTAPKQTVEALLESGYDLVKEQKLIMETKLSKEYMKNIDD